MEQCLIFIDSRYQLCTAAFYDLKLDLKLYMEMRKMKSERNFEISAVPESRPVKRRRRDSAANMCNFDSRRALNVQIGPICAPKPVERSSRFRGVSKHRWTGRYEAHLWDKLSWNVTQNKNGKQVYLGAYDNEEAGAYDLAALKYWGTSTITNFPISDYEEAIKIMQYKRRAFSFTVKKKTMASQEGYQSIEELQLFSCNTFSFDLVFFRCIN